MPYVSAYDGCWHCGGDLRVRNQRDVTRKKFCSHGCRQRWRYANGEWDMEPIYALSNTPENRPKKAARKPAECEHCSGSYVTTGNRQRWCQTCVPDKTARARMQRYGLSQTRYEELVEAQDGVCALCHRDEPLHVDHDHATGAVRGLLCSHCNTRLSVVEDHPAWLAAAQRYLEGQFALC